MTFEALLLDVHLDDVQDAAEAVRRWHAERILAESAEMEADAPDPTASDERREDSRGCAQWVIA